MVPYVSDGALHGPASVRMASNLNVATWSTTRSSAHAFSISFFFLIWLDFLILSYLVGLFDRSKYYPLFLNLFAIFLL